MAISLLVTLKDYIGGLIFAELNWRDQQSVYLAISFN